jgi:hypothetical protein
MSRISAMMFVWLAGIGSLPGQSEPRVSTKDVMRFKLHYAEGVLEGITTENHALIATNAQKLKALSQQADWQLRQTEQYQHFTREFARTTEALARAAEKQNVDAATVAYFQMTVSCVNCHRYLRGAAEANNKGGLEQEKDVASSPSETKTITAEKK